MLGLNLLLALAWVMVNGSYHPADWIVGFIFSFLVLRLAWPTFSNEPFSFRAYFRFWSPNPLRALWRWLGFIGFGFVEIVKANVTVARTVLSPKMDLQPGIVAIPLDLKSDEGITTLANLITLTPGTVSLDVSSDRKTLYIHAFDARDPEGLRRATKEAYERRVMELLP
ncbi:MAG: Na+/H+ antiporter subunit E [Chloroflexaceae bacterium]